MIYMRPYHPDDRAFVFGQVDRVLTLATGAANAHALGFYHHLGYRDGDIKQIKLLEE